MIMKYLDQNGLLYLWQKLKTLLGGKVDKVEGKGLSTNDYTTAEKNKLSGIASGANNYTHPTTSGNKHVPAGGASGQILRWGADGTAVWGADNNTTYTDATTEKSGLLSASDKTKLNGIESGANKTIVDSALSATSTNPVQNKAVNTALGNKVDKVSGKGLSANDYTTAEKTKLAGIATGANNYVHPASHPASMITLETLAGQMTLENYTTRGVWTNDWNDAVKNGFYCGASSTLNNPAFSDGVSHDFLHGIVMVNPHGPIKQYVTTENGEEIKARYAFYSNSVLTWSEWKPLISDATSSKSGLLSFADKAKLDGIAEGANKTTVDSALSSTSTNPVQNKAVKAALDGKEASFTKNSAFNKNFGTAAGTVCQGNDARLSDARPANGGNSSTVNGHSVLSDVPANAVFTDTKYTVATASKDGLMSKADFSKLSGFSVASNYALKSDITGVYKYKGSKSTEADLPATGNTLGDVWNVETDGQNYAWDGQKWDGLGAVFEIISITNAEIDTIFAS